MPETGTPVRVEVDGRTLSLVNLDKVMYPEVGTTKADVLRYYAEIAPVLLPHVGTRPVTRVRWPHGTGGESFYEKNVPAGTPPWVRVVDVGSTFPIIDSVATLTWLANLAALELHVHQWQVDAEDRPLAPDRLVIDLDPGEPAGLHECAQAALLVRDRLDALGFECFPVTSGSKGVHLYASVAGSPLMTATASEEPTRELGKALAAELAEAHPHLIVSEMTKARRGGKVFFDWSQNITAKTTITPYSLRGGRRPYAAAPRSWDEMEACAEDPLAIDQLSYTEVLARVESDGDLLQGLLR